MQWRGRAVARRHGPDEDNRRRQATPGTLQKKQRRKKYQHKISAEPPLHGEVHKTCKKERRLDGRQHIYGTKAVNNTYTARRPHMHNLGTKAVNNTYGTKANNMDLYLLLRRRTRCTAWMNVVNVRRRRSSLLLPPPSLLLPSGMKTKRY